MRVFTDLTVLPVFRKAVITIGSFDGVHTGHWHILEKVQSIAQATGGESVVITFDPHPRTVLVPGDTNFQLITTTAEKIDLLATCGIDNVVVVPFDADFARLTARQYVEDFLVKKFQPAHIVIGYDHRFGNNREGNIDFLKQYAIAAGFTVDEIPAQEVDAIAVSSSKIRQALDIADIKHANRLLGHPFSFSGRVVHGNHLGRTIGFPTANIEIADSYKLVLPEGIYAARVGFARESAPLPPSPPLPPHEGGDTTHKPLASPLSPQAAEPNVLPPSTGGPGGAAMLYIGHRPTIENAGHQVIEVNILDFEGDLYGQNLTVEVLDFIRPDKKLDGLEALQAQIAADKVEIEKRLGLLQEVQGKATTVAIVILNYNTRRHLAEYLPSVIAHSQGARIIVADNGSPDDSVAFLRANYPAIEVLDLQRNYGFAQGYNEALKQVKADIYVILNSDVEVAPGWLDPVLKAMHRDPSIGIAQPKILAWTDKIRFEYAGAAGGWIDALGYPFCRGRIFSQSEVDHGQYNQPQACFWAAGAAFFVRANLYHAFGGFDGDYFAHNEEIDFCWRIKRAGYSVWCIPQSVVYHLGGGTLEYQSPRKVFLNFRNSLYTLLKNDSAGKLWWLLPARFLLDGLAAARFAAKGQFRAIWAIVEAHGSFYSTFNRTLRKRRQIAQLIDQHRIGPNDKAGIFPGSIVLKHYLGRVKEFSQLVYKKEL